MNSVRRSFELWIGLGAACVVCLWGLIAFFRTPPTRPINWVELGRIPVICNGRLQPLDSVARNSLLIMRQRRSVYVREDSHLAQEHGVSGKISALQWLLEVISRPEIADQMPVFRVDHPELQDFLGLSAAVGRKYFSYRELAGQLDKIDRQAAEARKLEEAQRDSFQRALLRLHYGLYVYQRLKNTIQPEGATNFEQQVHAYIAFLPQAIKAFRNRQEGKEADEASLKRLFEYVQQFSALAEVAYFLPVPPTTDQANQDNENWQSIGQALLASIHDGELHPAVGALLRIVAAYRAQDHAALNAAVQEYLRWLGGTHPNALKQVSKELRYNYWQPFYHAAVVYVLAFVLAVMSWGGGSRRLWAASMGLMAGAIVLHSAGILMRMVIEHRPPVTNLYSSAIFVGWGAALLGWILEWRFPQSVSLSTAAAAGFLSQLVAHQLSLSGDTFEVLRAVLDTNFWLATHVVTITLGYSAAFVAGFLAVFFILRGVLTRSFAVEAQRPVVSLVYGAACVALVFSFAGTVLGGIWADQSWGRFWGWDPKENGALLIVLWFAMMLHARSAGMIGTPGFMNMAVGGNIVTAFSWFGVNMLGVGLHSYGFMSAAFWALTLFVIANLLVIALGLIPGRLWRSVPYTEFRPAEQSR